MTSKAAATAIASRLREAGFAAYFAGGCVRDEELGLVPRDYDIATDASPDEIKAIFPRARGVGQAFGIMLVPKDGVSIEVGTFRSDGPYHEHSRHPREVTLLPRASDAAGRVEAEVADARRRDFTINGLFRDPVSGTVIDHVGGREDIRARLIRAIGDPGARLGEDHLRALRAVRFAARLGFAIEEGTTAAVRAFATRLGGVSRERIGGEFRHMLAHASHGRAIELVESLGLDAQSLDEPASQGPLPRVRLLPPDCAFETVLAAWWLDRRSRGPVAWGPRHWVDSLMLSNREAEGLEATVRIALQVAGGWAGFPLAKQRRLAMEPCFLGAALLAGEEGARARAAHAEFAATCLRPEPFVGGNDLIRMGLKPGPRYAEILTALYDGQLDGSIPDRDAALVRARAMAAASGP